MILEEERRNNTEEKERNENVKNVLEDILVTPHPLSWRFREDCKCFF